MSDYMSVMRKGVFKTSPIHANVFARVIGIFADIPEQFSRLVNVDDLAWDIGGMINGNWDMDEATKVEIINLLKAAFRVCINWSSTFF